MEAQNQQLNLKPGGSATVIFPPIVDQRQALRENFEFRISNFEFINCSLLPELSLEAFKQLLHSTIKQFGHVKNSTNSNVASNRTIAIVHADVLFPLGPPPFLYLQHLKSQNPQISFVFLIHQNILTERLRVRFLSVPLLSENIHYVPLDKNNLPFKNKRQAKNFFLLLNDNQRRILRLLARGAEKIPAHIQPDQEYLEKLNIISQYYRRWKLVSPLLEKSALEVTEGLNEPLQIKNNHILIGGQDITNQFSPQQSKVMLALLKANGKVVSREQLARALWGSAWDERYSDWAIDQLISTLRRKLARLWISPNLIVSKKKKGLQFSQS